MNLWQSYILIPKGQNNNKKLSNENDIPNQTNLNKNMYSIQTKSSITKYEPWKIWSYEIIHFPLSSGYTLYRR